MRLIPGFRQKGAFFSAKSGCVLYADATYTRVYTVYGKGFLNVENDWDDEVDCPEVMGPHCLILEKEVCCGY